MGNFMLAQDTSCYFLYLCRSTCENEVISVRNAAYIFHCCELSELWYENLVKFGERVGAGKEFDIEL